jgi:hypothetical protein
MSKRQIKADEFRVLANDASAAAANTKLDHVREKFERSAAVWTKLADNEEGREAATHVPLGKAAEDAE